MSQITIFDGQLCTKVTNDINLVHDVFELRHRAFAEDLEWVPKHPSGKEFDKFDDNAFHLMVEDGPTVKGYLRLIAGGLYAPTGLRIVEPILSCYQLRGGIGGKSHLC